jgi:hypothetical protein
LSRLVGLDNQAKNVLNDQQINDALFENGVTRLADKDELLVIHDGSDIRKAHSRKLDDLGKVRDLNGKIINGYSSFNSIAVDLNGKDITLLNTEIYSNKANEFISQKDLKLISKPLSKKVTEEQKAHYTNVKAKVEATTNHMNSSIIAKQQVKKVSAGLKKANPNKKITHVIDRGADDDSTFNFIDQESKDKFVIRLKASRVAEAVDKDTPREKLVAKAFTNKHIKFYAKIQIKTKVYQDASCVVEWGEKLNGYAIVRVQLMNREGSPIFRAPMLLITNKDVMLVEQAVSIYHIYLKRPKIEGVFKFLKEVLGWEDSQIQDFAAMKTLLTFCYFVAAYFYEIESALVENEAIQFIAELGGGKGKVTRTYVLRGFAKMITKVSVDQMIEKHNITPEQLQQIMLLAVRGY